MKKQSSQVPLFTDPKKQKAEYFYSLDRGDIPGLVNKGHGGVFGFFVRHRRGGEHFPDQFDTIVEPHARIVAA